MTDKEYVKMLKERDEPMPMDRYFWTSKRFAKDPPADSCGKCGRVIAPSYEFCPRCGQRIDRENYKL